MAAAVALARSGWANRLAAARLQSLLDDTALPDHVRAEAGCRLAAMPGPRRADARRVVLGLPEVRDRTRSALRLIDVPGHCRDEALAVLRISVGDAALPAARRVQAAQALVAGGPNDRAAAITGMRRLITCGSRPGPRRPQGRLSVDRVAQTTFPPRAGVAPHATAMA